MYQLNRKHTVYRDVYLDFEILIRTKLPCIVALMLTSNSASINYQFSPKVNLKKISAIASVFCLFLSNNF